MSHDFISSLYRLFTGREPDDAGFAFWLGYLAEHGSDQAISAFAATDEAQTHRYSGPHVEFYSSVDGSGNTVETGYGYSSFAPIHSEDLDVLGIGPDFPLV